MARVNHVKKAQQRYATVPVIDPETGEQKVTPVISTRTGEQKITKRGKPVVKRISVKDTSKPLPMPKCDYSGCKHEDRTIQVGDPYKYITPKSGPYGGRTRYRHADCPTWRVWEYSSSLSARLAEIDHYYREALIEAEDADAVTAALSEAADSVRSLAEEKREGASNIEEGFGHPTYQSEDLEQTADTLDEWADEIENADVPALEDFPCQTCGGDGVDECEPCGGNGTHEGERCEECDGSGELECQDCGEDHLDHDAWRDAVESDVTVIDEVPL